MRGVAPLGLVVVVGEGQAPKRFPLVAVVVGETCHMMMVVVMVKGMMIRMMIQMVLDPGQLLKTMSNRAQNLHLSGVLLLITNGHLLICDWLIGYSKSSKKQSLDKQQRGC